jgi:hypothetical protein
MVKANFLCVHRDRDALFGIAKGSKEIPESPPQPIGLHSLYSTAGALGNGGFIVGFDNDQADIFDRQIEFIERAATPWAMAGVLQPHDSVI